MSGGGAIAYDPSVNGQDSHGYLAVQLKPGNAVLDNLVYTYRTRMDVAAASTATSDVVISSTDVASLSGNTHGVSSTGHINVVLNLRGEP